MTPGKAATVQEMAQETAEEQPTACRGTLPHLFARLEHVRVRIQELVAHRRSDDPAPDDPFRGLYISDEVAEHLLATRRPDPPPDGTTAAIEAACTAPGCRLGHLRAAAGLSDLDLELLLVALAPDVDRRFEQLYGYLNDDVSRRRATVGLALDVAGVPAASAAGRARMLPGSPLIARQLLVVEDPDRPLLSRALRVPDRVGGFLLGDDVHDPALADVLTGTTPHETPDAHRLAAGLRAGVRLIYLRDKRNRTAAAVAAAAVRLAGLELLVLDARRLAVSAQPDTLVAAAGREAMLRGAALLAGPIDELREGGAPVLRMLAGLPVPVLLTGDASWDPLWSPQVPLLTEAPPLGLAERQAIWADALGAGADLTTVPAHLPLGPEQITRAVHAALLQAESTGLPGGPEEDSGARAMLTGAMLRTGARQQNAAGLEKLARRIEPGVGWDDLVLPPQTETVLRELASRARHRDQVLLDWRMRPGGGRGRGVTALFAGDSGTGKTMSAEVIAGTLGLDLYTVDLATVVDKYVGETEKNLERIFNEAGGVNGVLLFDEADAIFGKRSEVRDAHDRYANIESAYLLQRMESFDGLAILATNLRANLDEAFTRRLDAVVDFPVPDATARRALWDSCLGPHVPRGDDLDLDFCANQFELAGGAIRSVTVTAAYLAAEAARPIGMAELVGAVHREYRKLGRLMLRHEFGRYYELLK